MTLQSFKVHHLRIAIALLLLAALLAGCSARAGSSAASSASGGVASNQASGSSQTSGSDQSAVTDQPAASGQTSPLGALTGYKTHSENNFVFNWKIDGSNLDVAVSYPTTGWLGVGFGTTGTMKGSNIIIGYVENGKLTIEDDFGDSINHHTSDTSVGGNSNLSNVAGAEYNGTTELRFSIPLQSGDSTDVPLSAGKTYQIIMAHGPDGADNFFTYHGHSGRIIFSVTL